MAARADAANPASGSLLSMPLYRSLWIATIAANIGTCMKDVGAGWLMTSLSPSPLLVALVQAATMLPMALFSLPSGALADIVDRRRLLIVAQLVGMTAAAALFIVTWVGSINVILLLGLAVVTGCGSAMSIPTLQAMTSEIVPRSALAHTVTLAGISNNLARIIGPAAGGAIIAAAGAEWVFLANALSMLGILLVVRKWKREPTPSKLPPEHLLGAVRAGFRYVHSSPELHSVMARSVAFFLCASALWSLLPLVARRGLGLGPAGYGLMLTFIGAGAISGALLLPWLRRNVAANRLSVGASFLLAAALAVVGLSGNVVPALAAMWAAGFGWNMMTANLQSATLLEAASWAKARAFGIFLMVFQGSMAIGAFVWGTVASEIGVPLTLVIAAGLLGATLLLAAIYPLVVDPRRDFTPSPSWPDPVVDQPMEEDAGPVLVTIEYLVDPALGDEFTRRLAKLRAIRLRDGAMRWRYWRDVARRDQVIETFIVGSWLEHLRQHERFTRADRLLWEEVHELHVGTSPPLVRHWIAIS